MHQWTSKGIFLLYGNLVTSYLYHHHHSPKWYNCCGLWSRAHMYKKYKIIKEKCFKNVPYPNLPMRQDSLMLPLNIPVRPGCMALLPTYCTSPPPSSNNTMNMKQKSTNTARLKIPCITNHIIKMQEKLVGVLLTTPPLAMRVIIVKTNTTK